MSLSSYSMHKIYLAAIMYYGLGSNDYEEFVNYNKIRKQLNVMNKESFQRGAS